MNYLELSFILVVYLSDIEHYFNRMRTVVVTRTYNEEDMVEDFLDYYFKNNIDKIMIFDNSSNDNTILIVDNYKNSHIKIYNLDLKFSNEQEERHYNSIIYSEILKEFQEYNEETIYFILDIDEFLFDPYGLDLKNLINVINKSSYNIFRTVFLEINSVLSNDEVTYIRLQDLYKDPIYKYNILKISKYNVNFFKKITPTAGFHRWFYENGLILNDSEWFFVKHRIFKTVDIGRKRINEKMELIKSRKSITYEHYLYVLKFIEEKQNIEVYNILNEEWIDNVKKYINGYNQIDSEYNNNLYNSNAFQ